MFHIIEFASILPLLYLYNVVDTDKQLFRHRETLSRVTTEGASVVRKTVNSLENFMVCYL